MTRTTRRILFTALVAAAALSAHPLQASAPAGHYTFSTGIVYDTKTKLTWQQGFSPSTLNWADAKTYCAGIGTTLGGTGWRLPTVKELLTLVDNTLATGPLIDLTAFPNTPSTWFWTSTPTAVASTNAWLVAFANGSANAGPQANTIEVRCVRGGS